MEHWFDNTVRLVVALLLVGGVFGIGVRWGRQRRPPTATLAPQLPTRSACWTLVEVIIGYVGITFCVSFTLSLLRQMHFFEWLYGPAFPVERTAEGGEEAERRAALMVQILWASVLALPMQVGLLWFLIAWNERTLSRRWFGRAGWSQSLDATWRVWYIVTPAVFVTFGVVNLLRWGMLGKAPDVHPLTQIGAWASEREWALLAGEVLFGAPLREELLFRGLALGWASVQRSRADVLFGLAILWTVPDWVMQPSLESASPLLFQLSLIGVYAWVWRASASASFWGLEREQWAAILASAAWFAAGHAGVWPSPIPLFILGMGLGILMVRTGSLWAVVTAHGAFNAVSLTALALGAK